MHSGHRPEVITCNSLGTCPNQCKMGKSINERPLAMIRKPTGVFSFSLKTTDKGCLEEIKQINNLVTIFFSFSFRRLATVRGLRKATQKKSLGKKDGNLDASQKKNLSCWLQRISQTQTTFKTAAGVFHQFQAVESGTKS